MNLINVPIPDSLFLSRLVPPTFAPLTLFTVELFSTSDIWSLDLGRYRLKY